MFIKLRFGSRLKKFGNHCHKENAHRHSLQSLALIFLSNCGQTAARRHVLCGSS